MDASNHSTKKDDPVIWTAAQASVFLESLVPTEPRPRPVSTQRPIRELLSRVGNPHHDLRIIHIAGSKGKGSTALLTETILQAAGRRTGTFTSPHLQRWTERFRIDGYEVEDERFAAAVEALRPVILSLSLENSWNRPSFFDAATAVALLLFQGAGVDFAIVETGLGGRLDATNVVTPEVTCITSIEHEHTEKLGKTLNAIAREKAGIIKSGVPLVIGDLPPAAVSEIMHRAQAMGVSPVRLKQELQLRSTARGLEGFEFEVELGDLRVDKVYLPLLGEHSVHNAAMAIACVYLLDALTPQELSQAIQHGLATARLPGRLEILSHRPWVIVDAAHTAASARALAATLRRIPAKRTKLVLSVSAGKDLGAICTALVPEFEAVTVTVAEPMRSLPTDRLAAIIRDHYPDTRLSIIADPAAAVRSAYQTLSPDALLCATGSVYMAGVARTTLGVGTPLR